MNTEKVWDVAVIGAGAAGLMTAILARRGGKEVLLIDSQKQIGAKILMAGGTRCNLTNERITEKDYQSDYPNAVKSAIRQFTSEEAVSFFKELGISVVLEPGGKYFPSTHSGRTVLEAFLKEVQKAGVVLKTEQKVTGMAFRETTFEISGANFTYTARKVVLTTGGLSYPGTGSDGSGYGFAQSFGHTLVPTTPSLTPLETGDSDWKQLSGVALPVRLILKQDDKKLATYQSDFLFTHFGFSGPSVLDISRHWIRAEKGPGLSGKNTEKSVCFIKNISCRVFSKTFCGDRPFKAEASSG
jgi:predicted Rossmann fold flavoprotein